jgi:CRISPR-associated endonuclease/helicase Cas3
MIYRDFFQRATQSKSEPKGQTPFPYQERFAEAALLAHLVRAPTGAGKTATAVLGWLWRSRQSGKPTPRRLVYCLPMRVLVEQTYGEVLRWLHRLDLLDAENGFDPDLPDAVGAYKPRLAKDTAGRIAVHVLMGGVEAEEWFLHPERRAILIGTQDMLLSRALNRGYAASRFHWPIDFGLLNNDCLWVFDEPQLMASGVSTSAQLAGLRQALGTFGQCPSVWMSATLEPGWLDTVDFRGKFLGFPLELNEEDYDPQRSLHKRMTAEKRLAPLGIMLAKEADDKEARAVAAQILEKHRQAPGTQTLVVLNTVNRAKKVYEALSDARKTAKSDSPKLLLVHSRFRPYERQQLNKQLQEKGEEVANRIIVATQVVEAGVDISSRTLITELAPWASIVQRIGRCNRTGDEGPGQVFWIDLDEKLSLPYSTTALDFARMQLMKLDGQNVSPKALDEYKRANEKPGEPFLPFEHKHVLRRRDLLDLFDTSPDLSGNDIDIQRFVRSDDPDTDVQVFWREIPDGGPRADEPSPQRRELCNVPVGQARGFLETLAEKKRGAGHAWDHLDDKWLKLDPKQVRPGLTILLPVSVGGYDWNEELKTGKGWDAESKAIVISLPPERKVKEQAVGSDPLSEQNRPLTIAVHTENVYNELGELLPVIEQLLDSGSSDLKTAARWHDVGKAHAAFQTGMRTANPLLDPKQLWAKSGTNARLRHGRKHFRHELASALAALQQGLPFRVAYLIAAHHGRARLAIRALPGEDEPINPKTLFALGVQHGDLLPAVDLGDGQSWHEMELDLTPMQLGGESSWTAGALKLLAGLGPFKLAYLEALLRAADVRASQTEAHR